MLISEMATAIGRAHGAALDALTRALWAGVAAGHISEADANALAEGISARRIVGNSDSAGIPGISRFAPNPDAKRRPIQRPPERSVAIERRRRLAASGPMPPALAARFTVGELAVMRIVGDEFARGECKLCIDAIAARAGVSRTTAQNAIRQAVRLGMLERQERRRPGMVSLTNVLKIVDREWLAWLARGTRSPNRGSGGGLKKPSTTDTRGFKRVGAESGQPRARERRRACNGVYGTGISPSGKSPEAFGCSTVERLEKGQ